jgi:hypothetical protein
MSYMDDREYQQIWRELCADRDEVVTSGERMFRSITLAKRMYEIETMSPQILQWRAEHPEVCDDAIAESELILARSKARKARAAFYRKCGIRPDAIIGFVAMMSDDQLFER